MRTRFLAVSIVALCIACGSSSSQLGEDGPVVGDGEVAGTPSNGNDGVSATTPGMAGESSAADGKGAGSSAASPGNGSIQPGTLTAGVWDDNKNFDVFQSFRAARAKDLGALPFTDVEVVAAHDASLAAPSPKQRLDIQIVIDTTGSMGDEIAYLNKEFDAMVTAISGKYPGAEQHWSLVAYKDTEDQYIVRWFDFRSDPSELHAKLSALTASGGGDFPEAPDRALDVASRLSWRQDASTARLLFWVADAPHHAESKDAMARAVRGARDKGVHIYPVASSGIDTFTEYTMRGTAQLTGGRYVFLTDDSGVGASHLAPSVPCFFVTKLNQAILRMVDIEMSGTYREPAANEIVRTGGNPKSGICKVGPDTITVY